MTRGGGSSIFAIGRNIGRTVAPYRKNVGKVCGTRPLPAITDLHFRTPIFWQAIAHDCDVHPVSRPRDPSRLTGAPSSMSV